MLAKTLVELPSDMAFATLFCVVVKQQCGLRAKTAEISAAYALTAAASASLGLAIGAVAPTAESAIAIGAPIMVTNMLVGVINPAGAASGGSPSRVMAILERTSVIRHAIEALIVSELDVTLARSAKDAPRMGGLALVRTGREVLERLGVFDGYADAMRKMGVLAGVHLLVGVVVVRVR